MSKINRFLLLLSFIGLSFTLPDNAVKINSSSTVTTQKWVWVGTSIPAMYGSSSYPAQVGRMLNDNGFVVSMLNESLASSLVPWDGTNKLSMSATRAELASKYPGSENNSYETKIIAQKPDVLIIDHGYNCRTYADIHLGDINGTDRSTFYGAYNYIIKAAYTQNPNLRIAIIIPANNPRWASNWSTEARKLNAMRNALINIASRYGCICVDLMKCMGYNDYTFGSDAAPRLTFDGTHMAQSTANFAAYILYDKLKFLAFDHQQVISMFYYPFLKAA